MNLKQAGITAFPQIDQQGFVFSAFQSFCDLEFHTLSFSIQEIHAQSENSCTGYPKFTFWQHQMIVHTQMRYVRVKWITEC